MLLTNEELQNVYGGSLSATLLNSLSRGLKTVYDLGRAVGSSIRRIKVGKFCAL